MTGDGEDPAGRIHAVRDSISRKSRWLRRLHTATSANGRVDGAAAEAARATFAAEDEAARRSG
jgi:hypothetical protein